MGQKDLGSRRFFGNNDVFADVFNFFVYNGRKVIRPDDLSEMDPTEIIELYNPETEKAEYVERIRDLLRSAVIRKSPNATYVILGLDEQTHVHYAMPARVFINDGMGYSRQLKLTAHDHKKEAERHEEALKQHRADDYKKPSPAEYLSGFHKDDHLKPVITLVVYLGEEEWDGPRSLCEMFGDMDPEIRNLVQDYKLNLICPSEIDDEDFIRFNSLLRETLLYLKYRKDGARLKEITSAESYRILDYEAMSFVNHFTDEKHQYVPNYKTEDGKEGLNMCQALQQIEEAAAQAAVQETTAKMQAEVQAAKDQARAAKDQARAAKDQARAAKDQARAATETATERTRISDLRNVMVNTGWTAEKAMDAMGIPSGDREKLRPLLQ